MHAGTFGEIIIKILGLAFAFWGLWHFSWHLVSWATSENSVQSLFWSTIFLHGLHIIVGLSAFCFARKISYNVLSYGVSKPTPEQHVEIQEFQHELILFGLGTYFCVDGIINILFASTSGLLTVWLGNGVLTDFNFATIGASLVQFVIAVVMILGRRPILRFVTSFRTKEYGKKR